MSETPKDDKPEWLQQWADNIEATEVLSASERASLISTTGQPAVISSSEHPHQLRDGGDVVFLTAIVGGQESTPGAMIRKSDGHIVKLAGDISAGQVDRVLKELDEAHRPS